MCSEEFKAISYYLFIAIVGVVVIEFISNVTKDSILFDSGITNLTLDECHYCKDHSFISGREFKAECNSTEKLFYENFYSSFCNISQSDCFYCM